MKKISFLFCLAMVFFSFKADCQTYVEIQNQTVSDQNIIADFVTGSTLSVVVPANTVMTILVDPTTDKMIHLHGENLQNPSYPNIMMTDFNFDGIQFWSPFSSVHINQHIVLGSPPPPIAYGQLGITLEYTPVGVQNWYLVNID